jgi:hypothetical protein
MKYVCPHCKGHVEMDQNLYDGSRLECPHCQESVVFVVFKPQVVARPVETNAFARQGARASWVSFLFAYGFAAMARRLRGEPMQPFFQLAAAAFLLIGFGLGITALVGMRKHGKKGILVPATIGVVLNGAMLMVIILAIVAGRRAPG